MALVLQTINIGVAANDGTGDTLRAAMDKINANFSLISGDFVAQFETKSLNFTAVAGKSYFVTNSAGAITVILPPSPALGNLIEFIDTTGVWDSNTVSFDPGAKLINGVAGLATATTKFQTVQFRFTNQPIGWIRTDNL